MSMDPDQGELRRERRIPSRLIRWERTAPLTRITQLDRNAKREGEGVAPAIDRQVLSESPGGGATRGTWCEGPAGR